MGTAFCLGSNRGGYSCSVDDEVDCRCDDRGRECCDAGRRCRDGECCQACGRNEAQCNLCDSRGKGDTTISLTTLSVMTLVTILSITIKNTTFRIIASIAYAVCRNADSRLSFVYSAFFQLCTDQTKLQTSDN